MSIRSSLSTFTLLMVISQWPLQSGEEMPSTQSNNLEILNIETSSSNQLEQSSTDKSKSSSVIDSSAQTDSKQKIYDGFVNTTYRLRTNEHTDDHDLYSTLGLNVNLSQKASLHFLGRLAIDLDGSRDQSGYYTFDSVADSNGKYYDEKVFSAYADIKKLGIVEHLRLGRQVVNNTPETAFLDGISTESSPFGNLKLKLGAYAGVPVRFYGSSSDDSLVGGYIHIQPTNSLKVRLDYMRSTEDRNPISQNDDTISINIEKRIRQNSKVLAAYSMFENQSKDLSLRYFYRQLENDLSVSCYFYSLLQTQKDFSLESDPFYSSTQELYPYNKGSVLVSKGFGESWIVDFGVDLRRLKNDQNIGTYNREYERYFITPMLLDQPWKGGTFSVTVDYWKSGEREILAYGGDFSHHCSKDLEASIGTLFSMYKYDLYSDSEKEDVQTYFLKAKYKISQALKFNSSYEFENDSLESYHIIKLGLACLF